MTLPMYCIWRRRASWLVMRCASSTAFSSTSGSASASSCIGGRSTSAAPSFCSSSTVLLFLRAADEFAVVFRAHRLYDSAPCRRHHRFTYAPAQLEEFAQAVLDAAKRAGASACECEVSEGYGLSVTVRKDEPETIEHNRDKGIGVTVYFGERPKARRGHASTSDFSAAALASTVEAAAAIARKTAVDDCAGPPEPAELARAPALAKLDLDLFHPWDLGTEEAIRLARRTERAAFALSPKISNSEGATVSAQHSQFVFANSLGFMHGFPASRHSLSLSVIAEERGLMQRDDWYSSARVRGQGRRSPRRWARTRAAARWRAWARARSPPARRRCCSRRRRPSGLIGSFVSAASGGNLYRKSSFLRRRARQAGIRQGRQHRGAAARAARARELAVRRRGRGDARAHRGARRRAGGLFPRQLLRAQARPEEHRQRGRQPQPGGDPAVDRGPRTCPAC